MRAKKAKMLRREAWKLTAGSPDRQLLAKVHRVKKTVKGKQETFEVHQAVNDPKSARGAYRILKRIAKKGR